MSGQREFSGLTTEEIIDKAGRARVFARARLLGWGRSNPPEWVWRNIAYTLISEQNRAARAQTKETE